MREKKFKIMIEYDGTDYCGWQKQPNARTVQGIIEKALSNITGKYSPVHGAGRTDAGVHASAQTAHFECRTRLGAVDIMAALAGNLPPDIAVTKCNEAPAGFHARFSALSRRYVYYTKIRPTALWRRYFHVLHFEPDLQAMRTAAREMIGRRDFKSFAASGKAGLSTICDMTGLDIIREGSVIYFQIESDRFLRKMVRTIVGTLLEIGKDKYPPELIEDILNKRNREAAGPALPPNGLFLTGVTYKK